MSYLAAAKRTRQPGDAAVLDVASPFSRGLRAVFDLRSGSELLSRARMGSHTSNRTALGRQGEGRYYQQISPESTIWAHRPAYATTGNMSLLVVCDIRTVGFQYGTLAKKADYSGATGPFYVAACDEVGDGKLTVIESASLGVSSVWALSTQVIFDGFSGAIVLTRNGSTTQSGSRTFFVNGAKYAAALRISTGADSAIADDGVSPVEIGNFALNKGARLDGMVYLAALWDRALFDTEAIELSRNPWQLLQPRRQSLYALPATTGPYLSAATVIDIGTTSVRPRVTLNI